MIQSKSDSRIKLIKMMLITSVSFITLALAQVLYYPFMGKMGFPQRSRVSS